MKYENYEVTGNYKLNKKNVEEILGDVDLNEEEQTYINQKCVYEVHISKKEIYIKKFSYEQYAAYYGEGTLEDLKERLQ